jgi:trk system potassium uptake protein TrkH
MRINVIVQQGLREIKRLIHPHALYPIRVGKQLLEEKTVEAVWGFVAMYILVFVILMLFMIQTGLDQVTAFSAIATCMNNLGPGLGDVTTTFAGISDSGKIIAMIAMLLGRLEVFTVLVILTPSFWRQ